MLTKQQYFMWKKVRLLKFSGQALILASGLVLTGVVYGQTADEFVVYRAALKEMEMAQKMIREGHALASTPDTQGLDRVNDNSLIRQRGRDQVESGERLAAGATAKIAKFQQRQDELRQILATPERVCELESVDGRKVVFGIEGVAPPVLTAVRSDLAVFQLKLDQLSKASQAKVLELFDPKVEIQCETTYGAHFFPVAYLSRPKTRDVAKMDENKDLPVFALRVHVTPRKENIAAEAKFRIKISSEWLALREQGNEYTLSLSSEPSHTLELPLVFDEPSLRQRAGSRTRKIAIEVSCGSVGVYRTSLDIFEHGINDLPLCIKETDGRVLDTKYLAACFVDEALPLFEEVKKRALELKLVPSFGGGSDNAEATRREMFALWFYLAEKGVKYSSAIETGSVGGDYLSQRVRFPSEIGNALQANCVDGTILLASFAMNLGFDPILIIKPKHMYLGVKDKSKQLFLIETTLIGETKFSSDSAIEDKIAAARESFGQAQGVAWGNLGGDVDKIKRALIVQRYFPGAVDIGSIARDYQFVDVRHARRSGIQRVALE